MKRSSYDDRDYGFGQMMLTLRTQIGLTQTNLAESLGVSRRALADWEGGLAYPKAEHLKAFLALCVRASAFAAGREEEQIRALWRAARQKVQLDEYWLSELLSQPSPTSARLAGEQPPAAARSSASSSEELALWTVPYARNPHFTGRDELLSHLERQFTRRSAEQPTTIHHAALTQSQAIKGLGGIGKTQTAIEYAYRAREQGRYTHTLWISAASEEAVIASFTALKDRVPALGEKEESDQRALVNKALRWLEQRPEPWLLIYDNADETAFLPAYLPIQGQGSILFTTRASAVGALAPSLEVDALPLEEGVQLLLRRAGRAGEITAQEREKATAIVLALGRFPLAIDQAGAYLEETGCSLDDYIQIYQPHQYELQARRGKQATGYPDSVATTWSLAFEQIELSDPAAAQLLQLCAFAAPDQIPEELLTEGAAFWPAALQEAVRDRFRFNQMLATLLAFSLIKRVRRERQLSIHRLVQTVQQARMTPEEQRQWAERFVLAVQAVFPRDPEEIDSWLACQRHLDQALACETLIQQYHLLLPQAADVLDRTGTYLIERALYSVAEPLLQRALDMREQLLGPEHPEVATSLHHLARLSWRLKEFAQAEALHQRRLRVLEQHLGDAHPDVAESLNDLALIYYERGNYTQAEPLFQRAIAIDEQVRGPDDPYLAVDYNNLANLYLKLRKYGQAEPLFQRALHIDEQRMGPEHPSVAYPLHLLALVAGKYGMEEESERLDRQALRIWEEQLGAEHPSVARALHGLALLSARQGRESQAEALFQRALRIRQQRMGETHLETAQILDDFAGFQQAQGRTQEAAVLYQRALTTREHVLGLDHQLTLDTRACLQEVLIALGQAPETSPTEA